MAISSIGAAEQKIASGRTGLADNFETFLSLLTAQLKNQDPLSPMDSNQFTAQLVQMSGVEQQLLTNDLLKSMVQGNAGLTAGVSYIGKDITAVSAATRLDEGKATWSYELGGNAGAVSLEILNGAGEVVWKGEGPQTTAGIHDFTWDGKSTAGVQMPNGGVYTLKVSAKTASGATVGSQTLIRGRATGVEIADGVPYLTIGKSLVGLSNVISVEQPAS